MDLNECRDRLIASFGSTATIMKMRSERNLGRFINCLMI